MLTTIGFKLKFANPWFRRWTSVRDPAPCSSWPTSDPQVGNRQSRQIKKTSHTIHAFPVCDTKIIYENIFITLCTRVQTTPNIIIPIIFTYDKFTFIFYYHLRVLMFQNRTVFKLRFQSQQSALRFRVNRVLRVCPVRTRRRTGFFRDTVVVDMCRSTFRDHATVNIL